MINPQLVALNTLHTNFWSAQSEERNRRLDDDLVTRLAFRRIDLEQRLKPAYMQLTVEAELEIAEQLSKLQRSLSAKQAVSNRPADAVSKFISRAVKLNPNIAVFEILALLKADSNPNGPIVSVNAFEIEFRTTAGKVGYADLSGLKDRLYRAKATLRKK